MRNRQQIMLTAERIVLKMKLKIFSLLIAVLMSTAVLTSCSKAPAGAGSSGESSDNLSTEQGGEPSASESAAESGEIGAQNGAQGENSAKNGGNAPKSEAELRALAAEMGYSDGQIDEITGYGLTLEQLLKPEENNSADIEVKISPNRRYALGGYWYFDGGAGLGCAYLKNLSTGKITVLNEPLSGYSCCGFTADSNIYFFDYALSEERQTVLNFYSPEDVKSPYGSRSPSAGGALIWNRVDYIASQDSLLTFWADVDEDFSPEQSSVYPQYKYRAALIRCSDLSVEELNTEIPLRTNKYGQIVTPELDRRSGSEKRVLLIDSEYQIGFSPFAISTAE